MIQGFPPVPGLLIKNGAARTLLQNEVNVFGSVEMNGQLATEGALNVTGDISVNSGARLSVGTDLSRISALNVQINGGTLSGNGAVMAHVVNRGRVSPDVPAGVADRTLEIFGNYTQTPAGTLAFRIDGALPGAFDTLAILEGAASLAGTVEIDATSFAIPPGAVAEQLLLEGTTLGEFDDIVLAKNNSGIYFFRYASFYVGTCGKGNMNCELGVTTADVPWFADALRNADAYESTLVELLTEQGYIVQAGQDPANVLGDVDNLHNIIDFDDIDDFAGMIQGLSASQVLALLGMAQPAVPESSPLVMALIAASVVMKRRRRFRPKSVCVQRSALRHNIVIQR
jgi:hypothetical protein